MEKKYRFNWGRAILFIEIVMLILAFLVILLARDPLRLYFLHFPQINGLILVVFLAGVAVTLRDVLILQREEGALNKIFARFRKPFAAGSPRKDMLSDIKQARITERIRRSFSPGGQVVGGTAEAAAAGAMEEMDARGQITRYIASILVFLGLLGTFIGLLSTIEGVREVITGMSVYEDLDPMDDVGDVLTKVRSGIEEPLGGMSIAFSTSLFGLAGSIFIGFLYLIITIGKGKHFSKIEDFFVLYLQAQPGPAAPSVAVQAAALPAGAGVSSSGLESTFLYLKAAQEALGTNLEKLHGLLRSSNETAGSLTRTFDDFKTVSGRTNELLEGMAQRHETHREALEAIAAETKRGNEQNLAALERLKKLEDKSSDLLKNLAAERTGFKERMDEHTRQVRQEIEVLNKTVTAALLDLQKIAGSIREALAPRPGGSDRSTES